MDGNHRESPEAVGASKVALKADNGGSSSSSPRMPRSERKAMERARKQQAATSSRSSTTRFATTANGPTAGRRRKHNYKDRNEQLVGSKPGEGPLALHSTILPELTPESSADDVLKAIKRAQNLHDRHDLKAISRFLLERTDESFAYGYKGSLLSRLAVAALHLQDHEVAAQAIERRRIDFRDSILPMESAALVRNLLRVHNVTSAWQILGDELSLPLPGTLLTSNRNRDLLVSRASALCSIASRHFFEGEPRAAVHACNKLASMGPIVREAKLKGSDLTLPWSRLLSGASQCQAMIRNGTLAVEDQQVLATTIINQNNRKNLSMVSSLQQHDQEVRETHIPCNVVYSVLNAMIALPSENDNRAYERLSNALVRRVEFVTGAINMDGCPVPDRGEAAFIGRSNVGKSSLVNMITNRKSLAYTSKRPGKTQQFNFFAVNDKPELVRQIKYGDDVPGEKDADALYLVDLPGVGYAQVPEKQRKQWSQFMQEYISTRPTLRVLFHLIDSRHGPTEEDELIMRQVDADLPRHVRYVIVLTKADKNTKGNENFTGKVSHSVQQKLQSAMQQNLPTVVSQVPVVVTSAETKLGRDEMWRYLCRAAGAVI